LQFIKSPYKTDGQTDGQTGKMHNAGTDRHSSSSTKTTVLSTYVLLSHSHTTKNV